MNQFLRHLLTSACLATLAACGGGGGDDDGSSGPDADVSGRWAITETLGSNSCGEPAGSRQSYVLTATQAGTALTVRTDDGRFFNGSIDGRLVRWTGSYADAGGTTTISDMDVKVAQDGNSLSGTTEWRWTDGRFSCTGRTSVSGTRQAAAASLG